MVMRAAMKRHVCTKHLHVIFGEKLCLACIRNIYYGISFNSIPFTFFVIEKTMCT